MLAFILFKCLSSFLVRMSEVEAQEMFDDFFEEVFTELEEKVN